MILDHAGKQTPNKTAFGLNEKPVLDSKGNVLNPGWTVKMWSREMLRHAESMSFFDKFIGVTIVDQFGNPLRCVRDGKGGVIELQEDKVKIGIKCPLN